MVSYYNTKTKDTLTINFEVKNSLVSYNNVIEYTKDYIVSTDIHAITSNLKKELVGIKKKDFLKIINHFVASINDFKKT